MSVAEVDVIETQPTGIQRDSIYDGTLDESTEWIFDANSYECKIAIVQEDDGYSAHVIDLPGTVGEGATIDEALKDIAEVLPALLAEYLADGELPWSRPKDEGTPHISGPIVQSVNFPGRRENSRQLVHGHCVADDPCRHRADIANS